MYGYLIVNGLIFIIVGLRGLFQPQEAVATPYGIDAASVDARNYFRSGAGGVAIAAGVTQILGAVFPQFAVAGLITSVTILGGLVFGRLASLVLDGSPGLVPWVSGFFEALGLGMGIYWLVFALN